MTLDVVNSQNEKVGAVDLSDAVFGGTIKKDLVWASVVRENASERRGTHATKNRALVSGGGKKPYKQKGTGRAQAGSSRSPLWRKGGTVFGPQPRSYTYTLPKKVEKGALRAALQSRLKEGVVTIVDEISVAEVKTKMAVALLELRGFTPEDFALSHPGGSLGRRLLLRVEDVMRTGDALPSVDEGTTLSAGLLEMSRKGLGLTAIVDDQGKVAGIFTDGDLRRALDGQIDVHGTRMREVMTRGCKTIGRGELAAEAVHLMERHRITGLLVVDESDRLVGALNVHDLLRAGVM